MLSTRILSKDSSEAENNLNGWKTKREVFGGVGGKLPVIRVPREGYPMER